MTTEMITEKLKVGDKVYKKEYPRWSKVPSYSFSTVARLTSTQAILENGTRLTNIPRDSFNHDAVIDFREVGDKWAGWSIQTPEIIAEAKEQKRRNQIERWFSEQKFTFEQKKVIFEMFAQK